MLTKRFSTWAWFQLASMCPYGSVCVCVYTKCSFLLTGAAEVWACMRVLVLVQVQSQLKGVPMHRQNILLTHRTKGLVISHDKTLEMLYLNKIPLFPGRKTNPSTSSESMKSPPCERSATVLGSRSSSWCWDKPHPGRKEGQIPSNLLLADTSASPPCFACSPRRQRPPALTAQAAHTVSS